MQLKLVHFISLSLIGGCILGISFPFTGGVLPLAFVAFIPLLLINFELNNMNKGRFFARFGLNYLYFVLFNLITTWWIYYASEVGVYLAIFANSLLMTIPFFLAGFITRQLGESKGLLSLLVLWLAFEWCHFYWELSWPWLNFGHFIGEYPKLIQWYEYSGVSGGSLWILLVNIFIYLIIRNIWIKKEQIKIQTPIILIVLLAIIIPISSSLLIYYNYDEENDPVNIVVVQPNIEAHTEKFQLPVQYQMDKMFYLSKTKLTSETDLVIWPETAIPLDIDEDRLEDHLTIGWIKRFMEVNNGVSMLIGTGTAKFFKEEHSIASIPVQNYWKERYNTAIMINQNQPFQIYNKAKLVLGGEKVPFIGMFPFLKEYSVDLGGTAGYLGVSEEPVVFDAGGIKYAPLICYESVYGDYTSYFVRKGAEIICVITNDGWWSDTPGYHQHRMFSRIRAIENRRSVARSANTGISCFIDQRGEIIDELDWDVEGAIQANLNKNTKFTFFTKYGDVIGRISAFLSIALFIYAFSTWLRKRGVKTVHDK